MKKLVIIPAYNEAASIVNTVNDLKINAPGFDYVVINDGSKDNTIDVCEAKSISYLNLGMNLGIGGAVQTGYLYAYHNQYDIAVQFDGDGQHDAAFLEKMADVLIKENADMVIGSRFINKEGFQSSGLRRFAIKYFTILIKLLTGKRVTDPTSGLRMCNKRVIRQFAFDYPKDYPEPETVVTVLRNKYKVTELPVIMKHREEGKSTISPLKSVYYMIKVSLAILIERTRRRKSYES